MTTGKINPAYANKGDLTKGSISKHLIRLTAPMIWGIFAIISFQLVDTFYIAMLGTEKLAAITFTFPVTYFIFSMVMGLGIGMSSVISRQIGEGNMDRVRRIVTHGLILALSTGLFLGVAGFFLIDPLFRAMRADDSMLPLIDNYMTIWFLGNALIAIPLVGNAALRASGDSFSPAIIMTVAAGVNIALDPLLIFGLLGFPRLEIQGAAIATVFANGCAMLASLYMLHVRKKMICRDGLHLRHFKDSIKRLGHIALPVGIASTIQPLTTAIITALLAAYGAETVAAFGIVSRLEAFAFTVIMALASGMAPIIGQNWGAGKFGRVHETLRKAFGFALLWSLLVALLFILFAKPLGALFSKTNDPDMIRTVCLYFWIVAITYAPGNLTSGWVSAFNAMGMPKRSFTMIVGKMLVFQIPLAFIGGHYFGVPGIFGAIAATNLVTGILFHVWNVRTCRAQEAEVETTPLPQTAVPPPRLTER